MQPTQRKNHWEQIYQTKKLNEVSWFQEVPEISLQLIEELKLPLSAKIIDVGGGDSLLADHLIELGYTAVSVLDISQAAIDRAKNRLGDRASKIRWIVSDILTFQADEKYDLWHDRAAFHFLNSEPDIQQYCHLAQTSIAVGGFLTIGTFSDRGPEKCSGISISKYSVPALSERFADGFDCIKGLNVDHSTPSQAIQNFTFCTFRRK